MAFGIIKKSVFKEAPTLVSRLFFHQSNNLKKIKEPRHPSTASAPLNLK